MARTPEPTTLERQNAEAALSKLKNRNDRPWLMAIDYIQRKALQKKRYGEDKEDPPRGTCMRIQNEYWISKYPSLHRTLRAFFLPTTMPYRQKQQFYAVVHQILLYVCKEKGWIVENEKILYQNVRKHFKTQKQNAIKQIMTMMKKPLKKSNIYSLADLNNHIVVENNYDMDFFSMFVTESMDSMDNIFPLSLSG